MGNILLRFKRGAFLRLERYWKARYGSRSLVLILSMLVGVVAALIAGALHGLVAFFEKVSGKLESSGSHWFFILFLILPAIGIVLSFLVQKYFGGVRYAKSLSPLILSLSRRQTRIPFSEMFTHVISSALSVGFGGSAGLEAPSVLTGAAIGSNTGNLFGIDRRQQLLLIGCGGAAAIAAIFRSPIGGILFAIEVLMPEFSVAALVPMLISSAVAMVVSRSLFTHEQTLLVINNDWRTDAIPFYFLCGLVCALVGVFMIRTAYAMGAWLKKNMPSKWRRLWFGAAVLVVLLALFPLLRGQGYTFIARLYDGDLDSIARSAPLLSKLPVPLLLTLLLTAAIFLKVVTSVLTVDSGGDGGIFAPTMFVGAFTGFAFARLINLTGIIELQEPNFIVVGICGVFTAVLRAPLTGIFLIADVTASYILLVPLMIVSSVSWFTARIFESHSIYLKALMEGGLLSGDRDNSMLKRFTVRICLNTNYTVLDAGRRLDDMREKLTDVRSQEVFPVLDEKRELCGIVYLDKMLPLMLDPALSKSLLIFDLMSPPKGAIAEDDDLALAMKNLERFKLNHLPVYKKDGSFMGFVSRTDIFRLYRSIVRDGDSY